MATPVIASPPPPAAFSRHSATLAGVLAAFGISGLLTAGGLAWQHTHAIGQRLADGTARARTQAARTAAAIDASLAAAMPVAQQAARELARPGLTPADASARLRAIAEAHRTLSGVGAAFQAGALGSAKRLFAPHVSPQRLSVVDVADAYDYTKFERRWYGDPLLDGAMWNEPLRGPSGDIPQAMYAVPIVRTGETAPIGIAYATIALADLQKTIDNAALDTGGWAFVFSSQGHYAAHPRQLLVASRATVFETAWNAGDTGLHSLAIHSLKGERGLVQTTDPTTGQASWIAYEPIKSAGWTLAAVYFANGFRPDVNRERRDFFRIITAATSGVGLLGLALFVLFCTGREGRLWAVAITMSVFIGGGIGLLWYVADRFPADTGVERTKILDAASSEEYLHDAESLAGRPLGRVPTGVFVKSIEFLSSSNVAVTGNIWQRLPAPAPAAPQFALAEADKPEIKEVSRTRAGSDEIVLWSFAATLRERFDYKRYPFDRQDVWVRLRPAIVAGPQVLVPDFASYPLTDPVTKPGVAADIVLPGWAINGSYFDFRPARYNATFGASDARLNGAAPEMYFNVDVTRQFLGPFVANIIPLGVAAVMIFALLLIGSKDERKTRFAGFTAKDVVKGSAAIFFVISYQHIALRNSLASPHLIYFEYFYFTTYLGLLFSMMNGILFASGHGGPMLEFRDNLIPKIVFWPTAVTCLYYVTLAIFY